MTSTEGYYYTDLKDVYFKKNVELVDPKYFIKTDSLLYNTENSTARFIAETFIRDSSGRTVTTSEGFYNLQTGKAEFGQRPVIKDGKVTITANRVAFDDSTGISQAEGNAIIVDSANQTTIIAGSIFRNKFTEALLATKKPIMIIKQEEDSIFIAADTLFSARLTDLYRMQDSLAKIMERIAAVEAAHADSVRIDSLARVKPKPKDSTAIIDSVPIDSLGISDSLLIDSSLKDTTGNSLIPVPDTMGIAAKQIPPIDSASIDTLSIKPNPDSIKVDTIRQKPTRDSVLIDTAMVKQPPDTTVSQPGDSILSHTLTSKELAAINEKDSTNRYLEAYGHVRIFSDSMQAASDSMFYSFKDSIFRLFQDPVVWSNKSQITGDTILMYTKNKKADRGKVFTHSFMINQLESEIFNQVKSTRMDAYFTDGTLDSARANGMAECIYYIQDDDSAYTGINESKSDIMDVYFLEKELRKVVSRSSVMGTIWPIKQKNPLEMRLEGFRWLEDRRPKSKLDLFE